jgi:SAM-dependent methyltransferase
MHYSAEQNIRRFVSTYIKSDREGILIDLGSQIYHGQFTIKNIIPSNINYIGVDFQDGYNVDMVMRDPYKIDLADNSVDYVVSTSCFEHTEFFWLSFIEIMRVLKPHGIFYLCAPSNGAFHRYPTDCWRFYPDAALALQKWGWRNNVNCIALEQFTGKRDKSIWFDYVAVFLKDASYLSEYHKRIIDQYEDYINGSKYPDIEKFKNYFYWTNISKNPLKNLAVNPDKLSLFKLFKLAISRRIKGF